MKVIATPLPGVLILQPTVFSDERGFFMESFSQRALDAALGRAVTFVQDNHSQSRRNVLRGLHYQLDPHAQGKLVWVVRGSVFDVAVDIRKGSPTCGRWFGATLDATSHRQMWIPEGFAHGYLALEDDTHFLYKATGYYAREWERGILWNDPTLGIDWPLPGGVAPLVATKDARAPGFTSLELL
jgi:dTDP-4-dehydrorhamnose 3,5-epimerase